jgi:Trypsin
VRRIGRGRARSAVLTVVGALALVGLVPVAPHLLQTAQAEFHPAQRPSPRPRRPSPTAVPAPPDDWNRQGTYLAAAQAYPAVVQVIGAEGEPFCSGSVVHSPGGDIVITAAHCVYANNTYSTGLSVVPGMTGGKGPFGSWQVERIWVDQHYTSSHDERYDYAFLQVSQSGGRQIEDAAGANTLSVNQPYDLTNVTTTGYPDSGNPGDRQITCHLATFRSQAHQAYREMHCGGYTAGVSGGPWVLLGSGARTGDLVGIIGGFNGGGPADNDPHEDAISYSPYFTPAARTLLDEAARDTGGHGS